MNINVMITKYNIKINMVRVKKNIFCFGSKSLLKLSADYELDITDWWLQDYIKSNNVYFGQFLMNVIKEKLAENVAM